MNIVCWRRDERGVTLIELLITLSLSMIVFILFPFVVHVISHSYDLQTTQQHRVHLFLTFVAQDFRAASSFTTKEDLLELHMLNGDVLTIERLPNTKQIRWQRNRAGHVLMLNHVQSFSCQRLSERAVCYVVMEDGNTFRRSVMMPFSR